ncbi:MAG: hypothetical protein DI498_02365 [Paracoccus denitrificans]|nr:MAG: hypothetical protein DI498_02365 [Paracoccus denitrificans]PZO85992.1 MAG: hypothetical protein DI633_02365 [Paracoccus denitrificans]
MLSLVGLALGFSLVNPTEADPMNGSLTTTAIWQVVSQLVALGVGGYVAASLAGLLPRNAALLHGATVWGLATLAALWLATSAAGTLVSGAASAVSGAASGVGRAASAIIPDDFSLPDSLGNVSMDSLPEPVRQSLQERGITPDNFRNEARDMFDSIVTPQQQQQIGQQANQSLDAVAANPSRTPEEVDRFIDRVFGNGGVLDDATRQRAVQEMEQRFGITEADANRFMDETRARAEQLKADAQQAVDDAKQAAREAAEKASNVVASAAWMAAAASLLGLIAAVIGAGLGQVTRSRLYREE